MLGLSTRRLSHDQITGLSAADTAIHLALICAAVLPFFFHAAIGLVDMPQAIARLTLNSRLWADPAASQFYDFHIRLVPNMAIDLWGLVAVPSVGAEWAANLFLAAAVTLLYVGVQVLRVVIVGRPSWIIGAASLFLIYSVSLRFGLANYIFGTALMVFAVAHFEADLRAPRRWFPVTQALALALVFFSSLFPVLIYVIWILARAPFRSSEQGGKPIWVAMCSYAMRHAPSGAMVLLLLSLSTAIPPWSNQTVWIASSKLLGLTSIFWHRSDIPLAILGSMALFVIGAGGLLGCFKLPRAYGLALVALVSFFLLMPETFKGVSFGDTRLPLAIFSLILGCLQVRKAQAKWVHPRTTRVLVAGLVVAALLRPLAVWMEMRPIFDLRSSIDIVFRDIPPGSVILVLQRPQSLLIGNVEAWHLPFVAMMRGDYHFPILFDNYFITHKALPPQTRNIAWGIEEGPLILNCRGFTHVVLLGEGPGRYDSIPVKPDLHHGLVDVYHVTKNAGDGGAIDCPAW